MKAFLPLLAAALLASPAAVEAKRRPLPAYSYTVRCSGLTAAWMHEADARSKEGSRRFDAALFWGLATSERARRDKVAAVRMEADTQAAIVRAQRELAGGGAAATTARRELEACIAQVPPLDSKPKAR
jgi:hypothetical protein